MWNGKELDMREAGKEGSVLRRKKACVNKNRCVACGCCVKVCPRKAISIFKGIRAEVDMERCVGCGLCAKECPASIITIKEVEA